MLYAKHCEATAKWKVEFLSTAPRAHRLPAEQNTAENSTTHVPRTLHKTCTCTGRLRSGAILLHTHPSSLRLASLLLETQGKGNVADRRKVETSSYQNLTVEATNSTGDGRQQPTQSLNSDKSETWSVRFSTEKLKQGCMFVQGSGHKNSGLEGQKALGIRPSLSI